MTIIEFILTIIGSVLIKIIYDKYTDAELLYDAGNIYQIKNNADGLIIEGLVFPIEIWNPKRKTINDIDVRVEFIGPIHSVSSKTDLADEIKSKFEGNTMTSKINRLNKGNYVVYYVNIANNIDSNIIKEVSIQSNETKGEQFERTKQNSLNDFLLILFGFILGSLISIILKF